MTKWTTKCNKLLNKESMYNVYQDLSTYQDIETAK